MARPPKIFQPVIATGNRLRTGDVVFRAPGGGWSNDVAGAEVAPTPEAASRLQQAMEADAAANLVIDMALIAVGQTNGVTRPLALREIIRATGPTITLPQGA